MPIESGWIAAGVSFMASLTLGAMGYGRLNEKVANLSEDLKGLPDRVTRIEAMHNDVKEMKKDIKLITKTLLKNCPNCKEEDL